MLSVHVSRKGGPKPPDESHYLVARNGIFLHKKMKWVEATVPLARPHDLNYERRSARLLLPPLSATILAQALKMAKLVYDISGSEVCLLLHHREETGYELTVPCQNVSPAHIWYDARERLLGATCVGTIHSHADGLAYHSSFDLLDEADTDGVHITIGSVHLFPSFSLSGEVAVNGNRFPIETSWFQGLTSEKGVCRIDTDLVRNIKIPKDWRKAVIHDEFPRPRVRRKEKNGL